MKHVRVDLVLQVNHQLLTLTLTLESFLTGVYSQCLSYILATLPIEAWAWVPNSLLRDLECIYRGTQPPLEVDSQGRDFSHRCSASLIFEAHTARVKPCSQVA